MKFGTLLLKAFLVASLVIVGFAIVSVAQDMATVITGNAKLRGTPSINGKVVADAQMARFSN